MTRGISSLEADKDGTSGGSQQWRTRGVGDLTTFHSPNLAISGDDAKKKGCAEVIAFSFLVVCSSLC